ncbi:hypothetical protein HDV00_011123 [Rhizophlyctis rosea]|nr:hypothetical protein HDV00_011123 [Rhizophlyctis rosea]
MLPRVALTALKRSAAPARSAQLVPRFSANNSPARSFASGHHDDVHHDHGNDRYRDNFPPQGTVGGPRPELHPEEYLKVGRNWPHEYYHPDHFFGPQEAPWVSNYPLYGHSKDFPKGNEPENVPSEGFNSPGFTRVLLAGITLLVLVRLNDWYSSGKEVHPLTEFLAEHIEQFNPKSQYGKQMAAGLEKSYRLADDQKILETWAPPGIRISFPGGFYRASDRLIEPGSQVDLTDIEKKILHTWQRDDDLFGPPFPKNKE